jgi:hypothetical protein
VEGKWYEEKKKKKRRTEDEREIYNLPKGGWGGPMNR